MNPQQISVPLENPPRPETGMGLPPAIPDSWPKIFELLLNQRGIGDIHNSGQLEHQLGLLRDRIEARLKQLEQLRQETLRENALDLARIEALQRFAALHQLPDRFVAKQVPREWQLPNIHP